MTLQQRQRDSTCWQAKAMYDQCFDTWYTQVFLQRKAHGRMGCEKEYEAYTQCVMRELNSNKPLVESIKSVMQPEVKQRFETQTAASRQQDE
ncbi:unnamed protein product [Hyaloperonospora brassicae]|uniref:Mitochondrial distribution and morphology protein 35 n=1 Tax=Hyaloperonospora brassicae TaxID=162125 RepID=A0AAV0TJM0_HYABA|nr:unnamed protein product [Hyaloperonospora brassicae]